jgi:hypothetical protein
MLLIRRRLFLVGWSGRRAEKKFVSRKGAKSAKGVSRKGTKTTKKCKVQEVIRLVWKG